jgi:hypothetical protein
VYSVGIASIEMEQCHPRDPLFDRYSFRFNLEITRSMEPEQLRDDQYCSLSESKRICDWPAGTGTIPAEPACRHTAGCRRLMAASAYSAALGHFLSSGPAGDADDPAGDADDN